LTFVATDAAGNSQAVLGVVERTAPPVAPGGLFGLGDSISYALLPLALIAGAVATYIAFRTRRRGAP